MTGCLLKVERTLGSEVGVPVLERLINSSDRVLRLERRTCGDVSEM